LLTEKRAIFSMRTTICGLWRRDSLFNGVIPVEKISKKVTG
jgi:hypothetical protein